MTPDVSPPILQPRIRFKHIKERGICSNWPTLLAWIRNHDFPPGKLLGGGRIRSWTEQEIQDWLDKQPSASEAA
jgi:predicted DNA-binding transcriptional regulator AlpA